MSAIKHIPHYTYKDRENWKDDWELISGVPIAMSPKPVINHQRISFNITLELKNKLKECSECLAIQEIDWKISDDTVISPDVILICKEDIGDKYLIKTPNIIFEILSPSTRKYDENVKFALYEEACVEYYVLVDFEMKSAKVYHLENKKYKSVGNFKDENFLFELENCKIDFEFKSIWV